jgi:hypothetical protein
MDLLKPAAVESGEFDYLAGTILAYNDEVLFSLEDGDTLLRSEREIEDTVFMKQVIIETGVLWQV